MLHGATGMRWALAQRRRLRVPGADAANAEVSASGWLRGMGVMVMVMVIGASARGRGRAGCAGSRVLRPGEAALWSWGAVGDGVGVTYRSGWRSLAT